MVVMVRRRITPCGGTPGNASAGGFEPTRDLVGDREVVALSPASKGPDANTHYPMLRRRIAG
jgi:hypothetical protein